MLDFIKRFFCVYWDDHLIFIVHLIFCDVSHLPVLEPSLHHWNGFDLIMVADLFNVLGSWICKCFVEDVCICVHHGC
jgi:hypothetical protein